MSDNLTIWVFITLILVMGVQLFTHTHPEAVKIPEIKPQKIEVVEKKEEKKIEQVKEIPTYRHNLVIEDKNIFCKGVIPVEVFNTDVAMFIYKDDSDSSRYGAYDPKTRAIYIRQSEEMFFETIPHESAHYAWDIMKKAGVHDNETYAYLTGFVSDQLFRSYSKCKAI